MSSEIKNKIAKLDAAIKSPATPANMLGKLKETKASFEKELAALESANKQVPKVQPKTSKAKQQKVAKEKVVSKAKAKVSKVAAEAKTLLAKLRMSKEQKAFNEGRTKKELDKDAKREALPIGKRISAEGNTYYEYRSNRADVSTKKKPYLEMGGELASKSHFKYYKVPNEQLWAIQECNVDFEDEFGGECIVIKHKRSEQDAIKEVERLNRLGYSDYEKGGQLGFDEVLDKTTFSEGLKKSLKEDLVKSGYKDFSELKGNSVRETKENIEKKVRGFDSGKNTYLQASTIAEAIHNVDFFELSKKEKDRLDYLQSKEDTDSLTKSENQEYEMLVEKYRKTKKYATGGKISNKGAYQNEPENKETYTRYADSLEGERAKPAGWRYTDAGAKRLKISNPKTYVTKEHLEKYRGKYFTDSKGVKHRYVYIERRADKSDIKRGFPYLERGGEVGSKFKKGDKVLVDRGYFDGRKEQGVVVNVNHLPTYNTYNYLVELNGVEDVYDESNLTLAGIPNNYEGKTAEQVWNSWTWEQKYHFIKDHHTKPSMRPHFTKANDYSDIAASDFNEIPIGVQNTLETHINEGQYKIGGNI